VPLNDITTQSTEGDVETRIILPFLSGVEFLNIPPQTIKSKEFLAPFDIGKGAKRKGGYIPDYCVYNLAIPTLVIEVKAPSGSVSEAWEEATLYAHAINKLFPSGSNPCQRVFASNGIEFRAGMWDSIDCEVGRIADLQPGSAMLKRIQSIMTYEVLQKVAEKTNSDLKLRGFKRPAGQGSGPSLISSKLDPNTFAADLAPILRRYFSSRTQSSDPEIYRRAYVSSNEITTYDRTLDSYLKDRISKSKTSVVTTRKTAESISKSLAGYVDSRNGSSNGDIQLVTGGVGVGKSLFARRYKEFLQPISLKGKIHWSFIDFNFAPETISDSEQWLCNSFVDSLIDEGAPIDPRDPADQERIFADLIRDRAAYYQRMKVVGKDTLELARDIEGWRQEPLQLTKGISRYLQGDRGDTIVAVFDNVDRRNPDDQLSAFQMAMWFMNLTKCLVILQMRDSTYEAFKYEKPLDTYRTGIIFHINPPGFIDVVKRRLELSLEELGKEAPEEVRYITPSGINVVYPRSKAGDFLRYIYSELFQKNNNVSRMLAALAGRDVRKALDMFMAIITSGHMPEDLIGIVATGSKIRSLPEYLVIKIIMRRDYRYFTDDKGFVSNIFYCDPSWVRPNNIVIIEMMYFLLLERMNNGENGLLGYVALNRLKDKLEKYGFIRDDIHSAAEWLVERELIEVDSGSIKNLKDTDCVKMTASGWAHLRILSSRVEYLSSVLHNMAISDDQLVNRVFDMMQIESRYGDLRLNQMIGVVENFLHYVKEQKENLNVNANYKNELRTGAAYIMEKMREALDVAKGIKEKRSVVDDLD
jgi:hypothetical protein